MLSEDLWELARKSDRPFKYLTGTAQTEAGRGQTSKPQALQEKSNSPSRQASSLSRLLTRNSPNAPVALMSSETQTPGGGYKKLNNDKVNIWTTSICKYLQIAFWCMDKLLINREMARRPRVTEAQCMKIKLMIEVYCRQTAETCYRWRKRGQGSSTRVDAPSKKIQITAPVNLEEQ